MHRNSGTDLDTNLISTHFRRHMLFIFLTSLLVIFTVASASHAQFYYPIGSRAAGMGDAYVALSNDASGAYHNPGGLAFVTDNQFSMNGNLYGWHEMRIQDGMSYGKQNTDQVYSNYWSFPSFFGSLNKLGANDKGQSNHTLGFSIVIPDYYYWRSISEVANGKIRSTITEKYQTYWFGPSYAYRVHPAFGLGISFYLKYYEDDVSETKEGTLDNENFPDIDEKILFVERYEQKSTSLSGVITAGARARIDDFNLGLKVTTPSLHMTGNGKATFSSLFSDDIDNAFDSFIKYETVSQTPLNVDFGFAWDVPGKQTIAFDVEYFMEHSYEPIINVTGDTDRIYDESIEEDNIVNFDLGFEVFVNESMSLLFGGYTNFDDMEFDNSDEYEGMDIYGVTLAGSLKLGEYDTIAGVGYQFGSGHELVEYMTNEGSFDEQMKDVRYQAVYLILGTTFHYGGAEDQSGLTDKLKSGVMK